MIFFWKSMFLLKVLQHTIYLSIPVFYCILIISYSLDHWNADGSTGRFHVLQTEWGIPKFIDLATFNDPSNGYLIDDTCVFGAEVFIVKPTSKGYYLSMIDEPPKLYTWKFKNFSYASSETYNSESFVAGNYRWYTHAFYFLVVNKYWEILKYTVGCVINKSIKIY